MQLQITVINCTVFYICNILTGDLTNTDVFFLFGSPTSKVLAYMWLIFETNRLLTAKRSAISSLEKPLALRKTTLHRRESGKDLTIVYKYFRLRAFQFRLFTMSTCLLSLTFDWHPRKLACVTDSRKHSCTQSAQRLQFACSNFH